MTDIKYLQEIPGSTKWVDPVAQLAYEMGLRHGKALTAEAPAQSDKEVAWKIWHTFGARDKDTAVSGIAALLAHRTQAATGWLPERVSSETASQVEASARADYESDTLGRTGHVWDWDKTTSDVQNRYRLRIFLGMLPNLPAAPKGEEV